jgi:DNA (cytosine-5)-methyltransferase 1
LKPVLLDLFCGAGGCTKGYQEAGFYVVGVDIEPQPNYCGDEFVQGDAVFYLRHMRRWRRQYPSFAAVHASPPCHRYSTLAAMHPEREYPDLIPETREFLEATGLPYVIENVVGAPLNTRSDLFGGHGVMLCGSMFGLGVERGYLRRHRLFETSFPVAQPDCRHRGMAVGVYGHGGHSGKHRMLYRAEAAEAMQIDWMTRDEICQAIPPAYTRFIGEQLQQHLAHHQQKAAA